MKKATLLLTLLSTSCLSETIVCPIEPSEFLNPVVVSYSADNRLNFVDLGGLIESDAFYGSEPLSASDFSPSSIRVWLDSNPEYDDGKHLSWSANVDMGSKDPEHKDWKRMINIAVFEGNNELTLSYALIGGDGQLESVGRLDYKCQ